MSAVSYVCGHDLQAGQCPCGWPHKNCCLARETAVADVRARAEKLTTHDAYARLALDALVLFMQTEPELICAAAKGRHAEGSIRFGDTLMYEYDDATLRAEALQELADAVNYYVVLLSREKQP